MQADTSNLNMAGVDNFDDEFDNFDEETQGQLFDMLDGNGDSVIDRQEASLGKHNRGSQYLIMHNGGTNNFGTFGPVAGAAASQSVSQHKCGVERFQYVKPLVPEGATPCMHGAGCYRKSPSHFEEFSHPASHPHVSATNKNTSKDSSSSMDRASGIALNQPAATPYSCEPSGLSNATFPHKSFADAFAPHRGHPNFFQQFPLSQNTVETSVNPSSSLGKRVHNASPLDLERVSNPSKLQRKIGPFHSDRYRSFFDDYDEWGAIQ